MSNARPATTTLKRRGRPLKQAVQEVPNCIHHLDSRTKKAVDRATRLMEDSAVYRTEAMSHPGAVRTYLKLKLAPLEHEEFHAIWVDAQNRVIAFDRLFTGSLTHTSVYPREVIKIALSHNAAGVVIAHNHPSGVTEPSREDIKLTETLQTALAMVDVKLLDHFIVAGNSAPISLRERGIF